MKEEQTCMIELIPLASDRAALAQLKLVVTIRRSIHVQPNSIADL